jgi:hypothetical protein
MRTRDEVYLDILSCGLLWIRNAGHSGYARACEIEADHLHNIPSLVGEDNELRHEYYFETERTSYLERIAELDSSAARPGSFTFERYRDLWAELEAHNVKHEGSS